MAWTTPSTWVSGAILTAAQLNTQVRDNLDAIGGAWTSFTPSWTNLTVGTGGSAANTGHYIAAGKLYIVRVSVTLGSSGASFGTDPFLTLPNSSTLATASQGGSVHLGVCAFTDSGVNSFFGFVGAQSSTQVRFRLFRADGTYVSVATPSATVPFTWGSADLLTCQFMYEAA